MKRPRPLFCILTVAAMVAATACGDRRAAHDDHDQHGHDHHDHDEHEHHEHASDHDDDHHAASPDAHAHDHDHDDHHGHGHGGGPTSASFEEGQGLRFTAETLEALNLAIATAEERIITPVFDVDATVFDAGPPALALAFVAASVADILKQHPPAGARVRSIGGNADSGLAQAEVVFELQITPTIGESVRLHVRGTPRRGTVVPQTAVLRTATGSITYVVNGGAFLRTPVTVGAKDGEHVEILAGLSPGNAVVASGVEELWLTELRLTKGGGHSH